jgi:hypothetical protein
VEANADSDLEGNEDQYYRGRILRVPKHRKLYQDVLALLNKHTVLVFLIWFYDDMVHYLEESKTRLPGMFAIILALTKASYYWVDCAMIALMWFLKYHPQSAFEQLYGIPHASVSTILHFMEQRVRTYAINIDLVLVLRILA